MFPDSNRRQTSLEKLKPKRHSAKALRLLPSILRGNKSIFHMTLSARGVLWLFLTGAVPAGAVFLTCTGLQQRWQMAFSRGHRALRRSRGGEPGWIRAAAQPSPGMVFLEWSKLPGSRGGAGAQCGSVIPCAGGFRGGNLQHPQERCWQGWSASPEPSPPPGSFPSDPLGICLPSPP